MFALSPTEFHQLNALIQAHVRAVEDKGLHVSSGSDPADFAAARSGFEGYVHPALDPDAGALVDRTNFFSIQVRRESATLGVIAARLFHGRLLELLHTRALWAREIPSLEDLKPKPVLSRQRVAPNPGQCSDPSNAVSTR